MKQQKAAALFKENKSPIIQNSIPVKMLIACFLSCIFGIVLMALLSHYMLMAVHIGIIVCLLITTPLFAAGKISINTACLTPMLLLCFVYTPLSWFTFDGLLGCTPYLSILYITIITLTYYRRIQIIFLSLYGAMMVGLTIHWLITWTGTRDMEQIINILVAYVLTAILNVSIIEGVKRKNLEINQHITDLSLRDDLTGLLNRRAIGQVFSRMESNFRKENTEYAVVMLDVDKFKSINDLFGHNLGDSLLKNIAASIQHCIRSEDYAFRFGGDEFLLILPNVNREDAHEICARFETELNNIHGYAFPLTVSKGFALRSEGTSTTEVLDLADKRMYEVKRGQMNDENSIEESQIK
ncbi:MAG: response regulator receiver modulated diguanylate cyclase [Anaerocolumna sp.]|nr:response regulator receiver modulated diguanylate cyclase [Anaerocolumna sp.]